VARDRSVARLFIALDPPARVCERLASWARSAAGAEGVFAGRDAIPRMLAPESMHMTMCFLGPRPTADIGPLSDALERCAREVPQLSVGAPLWLPPRRPRALAVEVHDGSGVLGALHESLVAAVAAVCDPAPDPRSRGAGRRFRPHITVARLRPRGGPRERSLAPTPALSFVPQELVLYRSFLHADGASYEALMRVAL
jgi:2'-5' RNA ligase